MRILVAGASGFIGKNFILRSPEDAEIVGLYDTSEEGFMRFIKENNLSRVLPKKCDLRNKDEVKNLFGKISPDFDVCVFLVGNSDIRLSVENPFLDQSSNIFTLLHLIQEIHAKKFIFMSSGTVYLGHEGLVSPSTLPMPLVPYGISKLASELYIRFFQKETNHIDEYVILRFFGAYGPMEPARKIYTNLVKAFCVEDKNEFPIYGNGKNYIDAMHIEDTVDALWKIIASDKGNLTLDFSKGEPLTINELVYRVAKILKKENVRILHQGETKEFITFYASPRELETLFDFKPSIALEEGIVGFKDYLLKQTR